MRNSHKSAMVSLHCWLTMLNGPVFTRDAMLARYMLSFCVRLSVRHKLVSYRNDWTDQNSFGVESSFHLSYRVLLKKSGISKRVLPSSTLPKPGLRKFLHVKSILLPLKATRAIFSFYVLHLLVVGSVLSINLTHVSFSITRQNSIFNRALAYVYRERVFI